MKRWKCFSLFLNFDFLIIYNHHLQCLSHLYKSSRLVKSSLSVKTHLLRSKTSKFSARVGEKNDLLERGGNDWDAQYIPLYLTVEFYGAKQIILLSFRFFSCWAPLRSTCFILKKNRLYCSDPYDSEYLRSVPGGYEQLTQPARILRVNFNDRHEVSVKMPGDYNVEFS